MNTKTRLSIGNLLRAGFTILTAAISANADQVEEVAGISQGPPTKVDPATVDQDAMEERRLIAAEVSKLMKEGATAGQLEEWHEINSARLATNQQKLAKIYSRRNSAPQPYTREIQIPPGATETMKTFLMERAKLNNERVRIHKSTLGASPEKLGEALEAWRASNPLPLRAMQEAVDRLSNESK